MSTATRAPPIAPAAARELLEGLTSSLEIPFTITDDRGAVVASTGGRARGQMDVNALTVLQQGSPMEVTGDSVLRWHREFAEAPSTAVGGGAFAPGAAIYLPFEVGDSAGVLIAHGEPDDVRLPARTAIPAVELGLEFARAGTRTVREGVGPGLALYRLLRGSPAEAYEAQLIAKMAGWDLRVPRTAIVALRFRHKRNPRVRGEPRLGALLDALGRRAPHTPFGRLRGHVWVVLPEIEPDDKASLRSLARQLMEALAPDGGRPAVGIGELHDQPQTLLALRRSYREALYAARCGVRIHGEPGVYELDALGAAAFLTPSGHSRQRLARRLLHPLADEHELLDSLRAFLRANLSIGEAANGAGVHRHTIRNHLERVHQLTGLDPRALDDAVQLRLALLVHPHTGGP